MHAIWSGSISFGLVNIPVKLFSGAEDRQLDLTMLHKKDLSPIRYAKICKAEGEEISYAEVIKGYEYQKGEYIPLDESDFEKANMRATHMIDIMQFCEQEEIDIRYYEKPYYLEPVKGSEKAYALLCEALKQSKKVGISNFVIRNKGHLAVIKPLDKALILNTIRYAPEVRSLSGVSLPENINLRKSEIEMALTLIDQLTAKFNPKDFHDSYTEELEKLIAMKAKGKKPRITEKLPAETQVKDLMSALKASLSKTPKRRAVSRRQPKLTRQHRKSA